MTNKDDKEPDNCVVVSFGKGPRLQDPGYIPFCLHAQMVVDEANRSIACESCGAKLDPYEVIAQVAKRERIWRTWDREESRQRKRLADLGEQERKLKARIRNASKKDAEIATAILRKRHAEQGARARWNLKQIARFAEIALRQLGEDSGTDDGPDLRVTRESGP